MRLKQLFSQTGESLEEILSSDAVEAPIISNLQPIKIFQAHHLHNYYIHVLIF